MRLLFVVQRYGEEIAGGAESYCRSLAERLAGRGHDVTVLTSCATSYVTWQDAYAPGDHHLSGVRVVRLPVPTPRDDARFATIHGRVVHARRPLAAHLQREWMRMQGPILPDLAPWLAEHAAGYDVAVFFTYLYATTWSGLPAASAATTTVLHPLAHDEPALAVPLFDLVFRLPHAFGYLSEEEAELVQRRFRVDRPFTLSGVGLDLDTAAADPFGTSFRDAWSLGDDPYLLYVGRIDPNKGSLELFDHFVAYKRRNPGPLRLVLLGEPVRPLPPHHDVVTTGFVDDATKEQALAGCTALVNPSYFESFSIVLCEAWASRRPAIVQGRSAVLAGMARRSGGAIPYVGFREFEAAVDLVMSDEALRRRLASAGRAYVERRYRWDTVLDRYEAFLEGVSR